MTSGTPKQIGKYQILDRVAVGGMAELFKAQLIGQLGFEKLVAIRTASGLYESVGPGSPGTSHVEQNMFRVTSAVPSGVLIEGAAAWTTEESGAFRGGTSSR